MALIGHLSRAMRERYSPARMDAVKNLDLERFSKPAKESATVTNYVSAPKALTH